MTIWTFTANPALDFTYRLPRLRLGVPHRIENIQVRPGGKGLNVSRVLAQLGHRSHATGFVGGANGTRLLQLLSQVNDAGLISTDFVTTETMTRMSIAIVDDSGEATVLNEAGADPGPDAWKALCAKLGKLLVPGDLLACCGSFPGEADAAWITELIGVAHRAHARVLVDATGATLELACSAGADLVKPNDAELLQTTGANSVSDGAQILLESGVGAVITSEGERGMSLHTRDGAWRAAPAKVIVGNPTGAGDASVAAWCAFLAEHPRAKFGGDLKFALPTAVALSGAAVACPTAGEVDEKLFAEMVDRVEVKEY